MLRLRKITILLALCLVGIPALAGDRGVADMDMTHRMMLLVLQLGVILFAAKFGSIAFEKIGLPGVVGELMSGVVIGPYLLGGIAFGPFHDGLFPVFRPDFAISPELYGICVLASIVLLFSVGLETDIRLFLRYSVAGTMVGVGGVVGSFLAGDLLAALFSKLLFNQALGMLDPPCLFLGIITTATSVGITARILSERKKMDSPEGVTILSGAVVDDVLGIVLLAIGMGMIATPRAAAGHVEWAHIAMIAAKAIGVWLLATAVGLLASRKISVLLKWFGDRSSIAMMALGLALLLAGLFEEAGLAMIIGAYVMGLSLSRTDLNHVIRERLGPIQGLLVPVFFAVMGMMVNVRLLLSPWVLLFGLIYTVVSVAAKIVGCGGAALFCNFNARGALRVGCGMLPRGEVTLIIAGTALAAGVLNQQVFGVVVLMTLLTSFAAPPAIVAAFRGKRSGLRRAVPEQEGEELVFLLPSHETAELLIQKLFQAFEKEGFFIHTVNRRGNIYQLRKDEIIIGIRRKGCELLFECQRAEIPFVNTAMYEVLAILEQTVRELRKPIDRKEIGRRMQEPVTAGKRRGSLSRFLSQEVLIPELHGQTKREIIDELVRVLDRAGLVGDRDGALQAVWDREQSMSTGMQYGIAIPHGRTDGVDRLVCAIGMKRDGVDFDSIDGEPSRIFVLALSPLNAPAPHMQFMSMISQALDAAGRDALLGTRTSAGMYAVLTGEEPGAASSAGTRVLEQLWHKLSRR